MIPTPFQKYSQNQISTSSNGSKVSLLLREAAKDMEKAQQSCIHEEFEERYLATERACTILSGLRDHMDTTVDQASDVVKSLGNYYTTLILLCAKVNFKNDATLAKQAADSLKEMADTWLSVESQAYKNLQTVNSYEKSASSAPSSLNEIVA